MSLGRPRIRLPGFSAAARLLVMRAPRIVIPRSLSWSRRMRTAGLCVFCRDNNPRLRFFFRRYTEHKQIK